MAAPVMLSRMARMVAPRADRGIGLDGGGQVNGEGGVNGRKIVFLSLDDGYSQTKPNARIGVLYQNDDDGKDYLKGVNDGLGDKFAKMLVGRADVRGHRRVDRFADPADARQGQPARSVSTPDCAARGCGAGSTSLAALRLWK
jgi:hypothetical protein